MWGGKCGIHVVVSGSPLSLGSCVWGDLAPSSETGAKGTSPMFHTYLSASRGRRCANGEN